FLTFVIVVAVSKYVSLGSLCLMGGFFVELLLFGVSGYFGIDNAYLIEIYILAFIITALAFIRHSANIKRLIAGNERKIGQKKEK
ncbi:MAG: glycerol-3-phosphate acyltransferase, partial [Lachnospiraceae bacterium]